MATHRLARWAGVVLSILLSIVFASGCNFPSAAPLPPGSTPTLKANVQGETPGKTEHVPAAGQPTIPPYDCLETVSATRPLAANGTGDDCWLTLSEGDAAELAFNDVAQVTLKSTWAGDDLLFFSVSKGDRLIKVTQATIRPARYIAQRFGGSIENVKQFEIASHSPGSPNGQPACLRDGNGDYRPLTPLCQ
jgi:hypothetical protein